MAKSAVNYTGLIPETSDSFESATQNTTGSLEGIDIRLGELGSNKADLVGGKIPVDQIPLSMNDYREGYYKTADGLMYQDSSFTILLDKLTDVLYLDLNTTDTYRWTGTGYLFTGTGALSSQTKSGLMSAFDKKKLDKKVYTFDTIADAQAYSGFVTGDIVEVLGYYTKGDGVGHERVYSLTDNGSGVVCGSGFLNYIYKGSLNILHFGVKKDGVTGDSDKIQKAIDLYSYFGTIYFPSGVYAINTTLNLKQRYIKLIGYGVGFNNGGHNTSATTFKAINGITKIIDCVETSDIQFSPFEIKNINFDGNEIAGIVGLDIKNRHNFRIQDCLFNYCYIGLKAEDTWIGIYDNLRFENITNTGFVLIGSNHSNSFRKITALACVGACIGIYYNDDYNWSIAFYDTVVESATGYGIIIDIGHSNITFYNNYHENMYNPIFYIKSGNVYCDGGFFIFNGHSDTIGYNDQLALLDGGTLNFSNGASIISPYFTNAYEKLVISSNLGTNGKIKFEDCNLKLPTSDTYKKALLGDFLNYKNTHKNYTTYTNGINLTATTFGGLTYTTSENGTSRIFNITSGGTGKILILTVPIEKKYKYSTNCSLIIVAKASSNIGESSALVAGLVDEALYGDVVSIGNLGLIKNGNYTTYIFRNINLNAYANYLRLNLSSPDTGGTFEIKEFYLHDNSMVSSGDLFL